MFFLQMPMLVTGFTLHPKRLSKVILKNLQILHGEIGRLADVKNFPVHIELRRAKKMVLCCLSSKSHAVWWLVHHSGLVLSGLWI